MNGPRFLITLTAVNIGVLVLNVLNLVRPALADAPVTVPVLRANSLQIVDEQGRVRASLGVLPASASASGEAASETVLLRLITERGRPSVKIAASEEKAGLSVVGPTGTRDSYAILEADATSSSLKLRAEGGRERLLTP